jgi:hypothetical protein
VELYEDLIMLLVATLTTVIGNVTIAKLYLFYAALNGLCFDVNKRSSQDNVFSCFVV